MNWRHSRGPAADAGDAAGTERPLSRDEQDELAAFHKVLGLMPEVAEPAPRPGTAPASPAEPDAPALWRARAVEILRQAGPDAWMSTGTIRAALIQAGTPIGRTQLSIAQSEMAAKNQIRVCCTGNTTEYAAPTAP